MKIFAYAGLQHHYLKLKDLVELLRERGHEVHWLTSNNAINIDPPADYLIRNNEHFVHLYDYYDEGVASKLLEQVTTRPLLMDNFQPYWVGYSAREMVEVYSATRTLIAREEPDAILILHENNFWGRIIALACSHSGVNCYSFQEGMLRQSDQDRWNKQGLAADSSTTLFCWSPDDMRQYVEAGVPETKLFVSGPMHLDKYHNIPKSQQNIVVLAMPLISHWKGDLVNDIRQLSEFCLQNELALVVRFHPREVEYGHRLLDGIPYNKYDEYDPLPLIAQSSVVLVQHSTIALEAIGLGIPIIEYAPSANDDVEQSWYSYYQVAPRIDKTEMLPLILDAVHHGSYVVGAGWRDEHIPVDGMARERVAMVIENG